MKLRPLSLRSAAVFAAFTFCAALPGAGLAAEDEKSPEEVTPAPPAPTTGMDDKISGDSVKATPAPALDPQSLVRGKVREQLDAQYSLAERAVAEGDFDLAERCFARLLALPAPEADKHAALARLAQLYKQRAALPKAAAVYEKILALFPNDPAAASTYLELGRIYRQSGLYDLAINRLYSVLNSALALPEDQTNAETVRDRRKLSLLARFEIAEASYAKGDYAAATKFYSRLELLGLSPNDRPVVAFKNMQSLFKLEDYAAAVAASRAYIDDFGSTPRVPEARNLLARSLQKLNRPQEAIDAVLDLLRIEKKAGNDNLARWQKETGRQVASQFYDAGDFRSALTIYQTLATLDKTPDWQWAMIYQIGLCFERMKLPDRAKEAYGYLLRDPKDGQAPEKLSSTSESIRQMARWRQDHLVWQQGSETQLQALLGPLKNASAIGSGHPDNHAAAAPNSPPNATPAAVPADAKPIASPTKPIPTRETAPAASQATPPPLNTPPAAAQPSSLPAKPTAP